MVSTGTYPDLLKIATIIAIYINGDSHPENYRSNCLLPWTNKILVRLKEKQLCKFWNDKKILFHFQFGFRKGHDTSHALLSIGSYFEKNEHVLSLYLDFQKAFDTVDHKILQHKLLLLTVFAVKFYVLCPAKGNKVFYWMVFCLNVLGPLLFSVYANDINNVVPKEELRLFADETNVFV